MSNTRDKKRGENLKARRKKKGMSQKDLAKKVGVTTQTIINWESGKSWAQIDTLGLLCSAIGLKISELSNIDIMLYIDEDCSNLNIENESKDTVLEEENGLQRIRSIIKTNCSEAVKIQDISENE